MSFAVFNLCPSVTTAISVMLRGAVGQNSAAEDSTDPRWCEEHPFFFLLKLFDPCQQRSNAALLLLVLALTCFELLYLASFRRSFQFVSCRPFQSLFYSKEQRWHRLCTVVSREKRSNYPLR